MQALVHNSNKGRGQVKRLCFGALFLLLFCGAQPQPDPIPLFQSREAVISTANQLSTFFTGIIMEGEKSSFISLQFEPLAGSDGELRFRYVLNRASVRESGLGRILVEQNCIELQNGFTGILYRDAQNRIIMTSLPFNSSRYWKIQEAGS